MTEPMIEQGTNKRVLVFPTESPFWPELRNGCKAPQRVRVGNMEHDLLMNLECRDEVSDWLQEKEGADAHLDLVVLMCSSKEPEKLRAIGTMAGWAAAKAQRLGAKFSLLLVTGDQLYDLQTRLKALAESAGCKVTALKASDVGQGIESRMLLDWANLIDAVANSREVPDNLVVVTRTAPNRKKETVRIALPPKPSATIRLPRLG